MADQPENKPTQGNGEQSGPEPLSGWHEPPVDKESSRPVVVNAWYTPPGAAVPPPDEPDDGSAAEEIVTPELPGLAPAQTGAWYKPATSDIDALLSGASRTIAEVPELLTPRPYRVTPEQGVQTPSEQWQQPQIAAQGDQPISASAQSVPASGQEPQLQAQAGDGAAEQPGGGPPLANTQPVQPEDAFSDTQPQPAADTQEFAVQPAGEDSEPTIVVPEEGTQILAATDAAGKTMTEQAKQQSENESASRIPRGLSEAEAAFLAEQRAAGTLEPDTNVNVPVVPPISAQPQASQPLGQSGQQPPVQTGTAQTGPAAPPAQTGTPAPQPTAAPQAAPQVAPQAAPPAPIKPSPFDEVERKVANLRGRFQAGYITREQLQAELRNLMILDDDGRWWMIGMESNRWYFFDGKDWAQAIPPGRSEPVRGSGLPTETNVQEVVLPAQDLGVTQIPKIEIDEDGMPLPARVPQDDPGATMVSNAAFAEPVRGSNVPTISRSRQVEADEGALVPVPVPMYPNAGQPARPESEATLASDARVAEPTMPNARPVPIPVGTPGGAQPTVPQMPGGAGAPPAGEAISKPKPRLGEFPQPDYREALGVSRNRNTYVRWGIRLGVIGVIGTMVITLCGLLGMIAYYFQTVSSYQDDVKNLRNLASKFETTEIYDSSGQVLATFSDPNAGVREEVPLDQISPWLIDATIATENETFYSDPGFSVFAIVRATVQNLQAGGTVSGASTITQQLAKALVLDKELAAQRTTGRKITEVIVASEISRQYSKNDILGIYLNEIFYGNFAYGAEAAAQTYFHKSAADLNPAEAAFLAGLPQSPAAYDPVINREAAMARMDTVLRLMSEANGTGCVTIHHADQTQWKVPDGGQMCVYRQDSPDGPLYYYQTPNMAEPAEMVVDIATVKTVNYAAPQFQTTHPHFVNYVWQQLEDTYGPQAIYSAGFHVYTTLDANIQGAAEQSVTDNITQLRNRGIDIENASVVAIRPTDGAVVAMVGSADYNNEQIDGQVNVAFTGQQPGSSIKPIAYLAAFMPDSEGRYLTPASIIWDVYSDFSGYVPTNYDGAYHGPQTARNALANSLNVPAVKVMNFIGVERFTDFAKKMGLRFPLGDPIERQAGLTTALGAVEVRLYDMTAAYATLANYGRSVSPYAIQYIEDSKGNVIYQADTSPEGEQVVPQRYAYLMTSILADNDARATEFGRGWPLELTGGRPAAVKTGTSNDSRDLWTVGYTPQIVVGVWAGNTDNRPMWGVIGIDAAAPIWNDVMEAALAGQPVAQFQTPEGILQTEVCSDSGGTPTSGCPAGSDVEIFANDAPPPRDSDVLRITTLDVDTYSLKLANDSCRDSVEQYSFLVLDDPTAYEWINGTAAGNTWAQSRGLTLPVQAPPTDYCDPNQPRPFIQWTFPQEGQEVFGTVPLRGVITSGDFGGYEIRYGISSQPEAFSDPIAASSTLPPGEAVLGQFDTATVGNGPYTLRLTIVNTQGRAIGRKDVHININNNAQPAPVPTSSVPVGVPTPTLAPTLTPLAGQTTAPGSDGVLGGQSPQ